MTPRHPHRGQSRHLQPPWLGQNGAYLVGSDRSGGSFTRSRSGTSSHLACAQGRESKLLLPPVCQAQGSCVRDASPGQPAYWGLLDSDSPGSVTDSLASKALKGVSSLLCEPLWALPPITGPRYSPEKPGHHPDDTPLTVFLTLARSRLSMLIRSPATGYKLVALNHVRAWIYRPWPDRR